MTQATCGCLSCSCAACDAVGAEEDRHLRYRLRSMLFLVMTCTALLVLPAQRVHARRTPASGTSTDGSGSNDVANAVRVRIHCNARLQLHSLGVWVLVWGVQAKWRAVFLGVRVL